MKSMLLLVVSLSIIIKLKQVDGSVKSLGNMIEEITGLAPVRFQGYGNYCGSGGSGEPVDNIDRCCQKHDECYYETRHKWNMTVLDAYLIEYNWKRNFTNQIVCDEEKAAVKRQELFCVCDKTLAMCLLQNLRYYDAQLLNDRKIWRELMTNGWQILKWIT